MAGYNSGLSALTTLVTVAVLLAGVSFLTSGAIIVTDLVTFLLYINNFVEPVKKLMNLQRCSKMDILDLSDFRKLWQLHRISKMKRMR